MSYRISLIFGTRPEAIKLCPVIAALSEHSSLEPHVCVTGQHREMLRQVLETFNVTPHVDLDLMQPNQTLADLTARSIAAVDQYLARCNPDMVLVQGDTTTSFCAALSAFYRRIPVGHVEAGLRTWDRWSPFPEETNRVMTTRIADLHFAPTRWAAANLSQEGVAEQRIFVTGNTVVDALRLASIRLDGSPPQIPDLPPRLLHEDRDLILITGHRRENFGTGLRNICMAIATLCSRFPRASFVYPVHLNPNVSQPVHELLAGHSNVHLIAPISYLPFVALLRRCTLVLTDSGGIQEEAPSFGKPVLVMRSTTERPEAVEAGSARLIGTDPDRIINEVTQLLTDRTAYQQMARADNPFGDGNASGRIVAACDKLLRERNT